MQDTKAECDVSCVTVVTVCFNSMAVLPMMLSSLPQGVAVVLVDNAVSGETDLRDLAQVHGAKLIENSENIGFGAACNAGAELAQTEFILFINPDAVLRPDCLQRLIRAMSRYPNASALNPRIVSESGVTQFKRTNNLLPRSLKMKRGGPDADAEVTVLSGAAILVRRTAFEAIDGFDPKIFLYHEDDDLSCRLREQAGPLMFISDAVVAHNEGNSTERTPETAALKAWHMGRSRVYALQKHGQPLAFWTSLGTALLQVCSVAVLLSKRKRAKQSAFLGGVMSTLRDGGIGRGTR